MEEPQYILLSERKQEKATYCVVTTKTFCKRQNHGNSKIISLLGTGNGERAEYVEHKIFREMKILCIL